MNTDMSIGSFGKSHPWRNRKAMRMNVDPSYIQPKDQDISFGNDLWMFEPANTDGLKEKILEGMHDIDASYGIKKFEHQLEKKLSAIRDNYVGERSMVATVSEHFIQHNGTAYDRLMYESLGRMSNQGYNKIGRIEPRIHKDYRLVSKNSDIDEIIKWCRVTPQEAQQINKCYKVIQPTFKMKLKLNKIIRDRVDENPIDITFKDGSSLRSIYNALNEEKLSVDKHDIMPVYADDIEGDDYLEGKNYLLDDENNFNDDEDYYIEANSYYDEFGVPYNTGEDNRTREQKQHDAMPELKIGEQSEFTYGHLDQIKIDPVVKEGNLKGFRKVKKQISQAVTSKDFALAKQAIFANNGGFEQNAILWKEFYAKQKHEKWLVVAAEKLSQMTQSERIDLFNKSIKGSKWYLEGEIEALRQLVNKMNKV